MVGRSVSAFASPTTLGGGRYVSSQAYLNALQGERLRLRGDVAGAESAFQLALAYDPDSSYLAITLAKVASELGRNRTAYALLDRTLARDARQVSAWRLKGMFAQREGRLAVAEQSFRRAHKLEPRAFGPARDLARVLVLKEDLAGAISVVEPFLVWASDDPRTLRELARIAAQCHRSDLVERALGRVLILAPGDRAAAVELSRTFDAQARDRAVRSLWRRYTALNVDDTKGFIEATRALFWAGDRRTARAYLKRAMSRLERRPWSDPDRRALALELAKALTSVGAYREAIAHLKAFVAQVDAQGRTKDGSARMTDGPDRVGHAQVRADALHLLGVALARRGRSAEALQVFDDIPPDHPTYVEVRLEMARLLAENGQMLRAIDCLDDASRMSRASDEAVLALEPLAPMALDRVHQAEWRAFMTRTPAGTRDEGTDVSGVSDVSDVSDVFSLGTEGRCSKALPPSPSRGQLRRRIQRARQLEPLEPHWSECLGDIAVRRQRYREARVEYVRSLRGWRRKRRALVWGADRDLDRVRNKLARLPG